MKESSLGILASRGGSALNEVRVYKYKKTPKESPKVAVATRDHGGWWSVVASVKSSQVPTLHTNTK